MRWMKKAIPFCLMLALLLIQLTPAPAMAASSGRPKTLDMSKIKDLGATKTVQLTIGPDLAFFGKLSSGAFTDQALDDLIAQVADDLDMSVDDFNKWFDEQSDMVNKYKRDQQFTAEDYQKWKDNILAVAGMVTSLTPGVNVAGEAVGKTATVLGLLDKLLNASAKDFMTEAGKEATLASLEKAAGIISEELAKTVAGGLVVKDVYEGLEVIYDEFQKEQQKWQNMQNGLNAARNLTKIYDALNQRIQNYLDKTPDKKWQIVFDHAKTQRFFTLFGESAAENWDVQMTLRQTSAPGQGDWHGTYKGDYTFTINYDMDRWLNLMPWAIYNMGAVGDLLRSYDAQFTEQSVILTTDRGTCSAKRELFGAATAKFSDAGNFNMNTSIDLAEDASVKTVDVSGISVKALGTFAGAEFTSVEMGFDISADENNFNIVSEGLDLGFQLPGASGYSAKWGQTLQVPWVGDIWAYSDKPVAKISIVVR